MQCPSLLLKSGTPLSHCFLLTCTHQTRHGQNLFLRFRYHNMTLFTLCRLLLLVAFGLQVHTSCYYPDGTYIAPDRPCIGNGTQDSFCCGPGTICLSDKTCYQPNVPSHFSYVRGSCTDQSFSSSACPQFCSSEFS